MSSEFEIAHERSADLDKKIIELGELNKLAYENLILLINTDSSFGKNVLGLKYKELRIFKGKLQGTPCLLLVLSSVLTGTAQVLCLVFPG